MVEISEEQFAPVQPGITLCYQTFGSPDDEPLLLIMGLGGPMTWWNDGLCTLLAENGFYVIRFDNRDIGRSTLVPGVVTFRMLARAFVGLKVATPYTMSDLTADAVGLLDHLGLDSAHVFGVSMGGMIAQTMAIEHPRRVRTLTSAMSTTGRRSVGYQHPSLLSTFLAKKDGRDEYITGSIRTAHLIGSPGYPVDDDETRARAGDTYDRGMDRAGVARQMLAVLTQPDRTADLQRLSVPTLVMHGLNDKMVHVSGGRATAMAVPGAEFVLIPGLGHDIPIPLWPTYLRIMQRQVERIPLPRA